MTDDGAPRPKIPDPASTFLGAERRDEHLFPSTAPPSEAPPPAARRWDATAGRWVSHGEAGPADPGDLPLEGPDLDPADRFAFPAELSERLPGDGAAPPRAPGVLRRLLGWLVGRRPDTPR